MPRACKRQAHDSALEGGIHHPGQQKAGRERQRDREGSKRNQVLSLLMPRPWSIILQENPKPREGETPRFRRNRKGTSNYTRVFRIQNT